MKEAAEDTLNKYKNYDELLQGDFAFASKHERAAKQYYALKLKQATYKKPIIVWICGPTGTGKSALASYLCGPDRFRKCGKLDWFDGYNGQANVTFDDFRKANCEWSFLLNILDHYKVDDMPVKGGFVPWRPKMIVFTSPNPPHVEFYQENEQREQLRGNADKIEQVLRRIDVIIEAQEAWSYSVLKGEAVANALEIDGEAVRNWALNEEHE